MSNPFPNRVEAVCLSGRAGHWALFWRGAGRSSAMTQAQAQYAARAINQHEALVVGATHASPGWNRIGPMGPDRTDRTDEERGMPMDALELDTADRYPPPADGEEPVWAFPTRARCPADQGGCGSVATRRTGQQGRQQYRRCSACGLRFQKVGWRI